MKTILVVDDDSQLRTMLGISLRRNGYNVINADSGETGLAAARQYLPDLILCDIHMPGGNGTTLLQEVRRDPELRSKQVVLMTGRPDLVSARQGMEEGADDFLVKPVSLDALLNCIKARLSRASINWRVEDTTLVRLRSSVPAQLTHELFTPLAGIIGLMELLRSESSTFAVNEVADIHESIYLSSLRMHRTLRNYLLILETEPVKPGTASPLPPEKVEDYALRGIKEALRMSPRAEDMAVRINGCSLPIRPDDLSHIVEELVDNAFKFSRQGTPVVVDLTAQGVLTVTDCGRGLTEEQISHIGAFQQFDRKKYEQQGLGLGLMLVKKLTAECGAKFSLTSVPGNGTKAQVTFVLADG
jgi:two-component system, sensor histidine kinase and response regulator